MKIIKKLCSNMRRAAILAAPESKLLAHLLASAKYIRFRHNGTTPGSNISKTIDTFVDPELVKDQKYVNKLIREMLFSRYYYRTANIEFFLYQFEKLSETEKRKYVGAYELKQYYLTMNQSGRPEVIDSKEKTYEVFQAFFHRDVLVVQDSSAKDQFLAFVCKHTPCLLKPLRQFGGKGIVWIDYTNSETAEVLFSEQIEKGPFLLEEMIIQDPEMAKFHPQSVNTIRYTTLFHDGELFRLQAVLRMGKGESFVDNASSGGIYALIDIETGILHGPARSFSGERYDYHPNTGVLLEGTHIPRWQELNQLIDKVVRVVPEQKQVGWDFALSVGGWVLVEANTGPAIQSFDIEHGLREMIASTIGQVVPVKRYRL